MRFTLLTFTALFMLSSCSESKKKSSDDPIASQVEDLLSQMTLEEKVGQMIQYNGSWDVTGPVPAGGSEENKYERIKKGLAGSMLNVVSAKGTREMQELAVENSRLGIPLIFGYDVIHGYQTMFPIPLGEAASWDLEAIRKSSQTAAKEASAAGLHWTFAPMMDIARDPRWGRVMEGAGEDPYLGAKVAAARVKGFQGDDLSDPMTIAACAKHFAGNGFSEAGREYNTVDISDYTLHNVVLPPFKAAADAGVATFMNAFNILQGVPSTANAYLQREILKGEWGWDGYVVSDWASIGEIITHGHAPDTAAAAIAAVTAGSDMDMESRCYESLVRLVKNGKVDEKLIDDAARRILRVKFELGLFDDPYKYVNEEREKTEIHTKENRAVSRNVAKRSIVLLKNEKKLLPLPKEGKKVAVIGWLAASKDVPLGSWRAKAITGSAVSLLEGLRNVVGEASAPYSEGYKLVVGERDFKYELKFEEDDRSGFAEAIGLAKNSDVVVMAMGEDCWQSGEARSRTNIGLEGLQEELLEEILKVNKNVVVVLMNGRPLAIPHIIKNVPALVEAWHLGSEAGNAIADVLFGDYNPSGKLPITFPRNLGQVPIYYNHFNTGRPTTNPHDAGMVFWSHYSDAPNSPLLPFGYGLSYTTFKYSDLKLSSKSMNMDEELKVSVKVGNTGDRDGEEVVQMYLRDRYGSIVRPVKELKGFEKLMIKSGEEKEISFTINSELISFFRADKTWGAEPGWFDVFVGGNSVELLHDKFELK